MMHAGENEVRLSTVTGTNSSSVVYWWFFFNFFSNTFKSSQSSTENLIWLQFFFKND